MARGKKPSAHLRNRQLTSVVHRTIVAHIDAGCMFALACELAGVPQNVADRWLHLGLQRLRQIDACEREGTEPPAWTDYARFAGEVVAAEARNEREALDVVRKLFTSRDVEDAVRLRAATWYLRQVAPHRYRSHDGPNAGTPAVPPETPENAIDVVLERLEAMSGRVLSRLPLTATEEPDA